MQTEDSFTLDKASLMERSQEAMRSHLDEGNYSLREKIALTCRILFHNGHDSGLAGQITVRQAPGTYITQRLGLGFDEITPANLLVVDEHLKVVEGEGMPNPANRFHSWVYRARPDVNCIVHSHAFHTASLSMLETPLEVSHMDNCILYDDVAFVPKWPGVPVGNDEGELISGALGDKRSLLLAHHGLLVAGRTVEEACVIALAFERAAKMQLAAMAAGAIQPINPALATEARDWINTPKRNSVAFAYYARRTIKAHGGF
ncbi:MAG: aldolase [Bosea sp.]|uniref:aldolase n=1 Tax=Bosea sp. (in: a-proteobacteria) TaxID=1871050 RepID=UPI001AD18112|nr:aldolase [Bosea sp. (in: a-proteobacteria)]MBN9471538.1 aldolase [Bosea sp. (in: a-proteobacteria)]